jgi:competence protein ComEA
MNRTFAYRFPLRRDGARLAPRAHVPRRVALAALLLASLAPSGLKRLPRARSPDCQPAGRGTPPAHWIGCQGDPGEDRPLQGLELVLLGRAVDLDRATAGDLAAVPGIGPGLAAEVVRDREERGPFGRPDGLLRVRGIGPARLKQARPFLTVTSP